MEAAGQGVSMEAIGQGGQWRRQGRGVNGGDRAGGSMEAIGQGGGGQWRR